MTDDRYEPEAPQCDGAGWLPPMPCCRDRGCPCDVEPVECAGCQACDPVCYDCGCAQSEHRDADFHQRTAAGCHGCGECKTYELGPL